MTAFGIVKIVKLAIWMVGGAIIGLVVTLMAGLVKDREMPVIIGSVVGLLIGLFIETFSEE